jgi:hypothetical protein
MGLLDRLRGDGAAPSAERPAPLARDAASMRTTLTGLQAERVRALGRVAAAPDLRAIVRDLLEGEVEAPTADVRWLVSESADPGEFYEREIAPNWEELDELERSDKLDGFVELVQMVDSAPDALPREMAATVKTKTLILAWAFDHEHGFMGQLAAGGAS